MTNERKRLEAISELFESEKAYVKDLRTWSKDFRKFILNVPSLTTLRRISLNNSIFLNTENIADLHEKIAMEFAQRNDECRKRLPNYVKGDIMQRMELSGVGTGENNTYKNLNFLDIYLEYIEQFSMYKYYIENLPKVEHLLQKEIATNNNFSIDLRKFLVDTGYVVMGYKHFIFRPTQKLARYPLLLKAIAKNTSDEETQKLINEVINRISTMTKEYDQRLGVVTNHFAIYRIMMSLDYKDYVKRRYGLGLLLKNRELLATFNEVYVKSKYRNEPRPYRIYLFDHMLLIVDTIALKYGEKLSIADDPMPLIKYDIHLLEKDANLEEDFFKNNMQFVMKEIDGPNKIKFLLKTVNLCSGMIRSINEAKKKLAYNINPKIQIFPLTRFLDHKIEEIVINDKFYSGTSFSEEEEERLNSLLKTIDKMALNTSDYMDKNSKTLNNNEECLNENDNKEDPFTKVKSNNNINEIDDNIKKSESKKGCEDVNAQIKQERSNMIIEEVDDLTQGDFEYQKRKEIDGYILARSVRRFDSLFKNIQYPNLEEFLMFISVKDGIIMKNGKSNKKIYKKHCNDIQYVYEHKILCFVEDDVLYWSFVDCSTEDLQANMISRKVQNYWYGKTLQKTYIVVRLTNKSTTSYLNMFEVTRESGKFKIAITMRLFVGAIINQVIFFKASLVCCCVDFEVVDMCTLSTTSLICPTDFVMEYFTMLTKPSLARDIFKVRRKRCLICTDKVGFFVNENGTVAEDGAYLAWYDEPTEFRLFDVYLIVLSKINCVIYDIRTGTIIAYFVRNNLRFVKSTSLPWLIDDNFLYKISLVPAAENLEIEFK